MFVDLIWDRLNVDRDLGDGMLNYFNRTLDIDGQQDLTTLHMALQRPRESKTLSVKVITDELTTYSEQFRLFIVKLSFSCTFFRTLH